MESLGAEQNDDRYASSETGTHNFLPHPQTLGLVYPSVSEDRIRMLIGPG